MKYHQKHNDIYIVGILLLFFFIYNHHTLITLYIIVIIIIITCKIKNNIYIYIYIFTTRRKECLFDNFACVSKQYILFGSQDILYPR